MRISFPNSLRRWLARRGIATSTDESIGDQGERLAVRHLRRCGLKILDTNAKLPEGEIDIVAKDKRTIVFVEVKTRRTDEVRDALEAVDARKQAQLTRLALAYLKRNSWLERPARFDVVGIAWVKDGEPELVHIVNAFESTGRGQMHS